MNVRNRGASPKIPRGPNTEFPELHWEMRALVDGWDGGAEAGRAHIMSCTVHPCPRCVLAEAGIEVRDVIFGSAAGGTS